MTQTDETPILVGDLSSLSGMWTFRTLSTQAGKHRFHTPEASGRPFHACSGEGLSVRNHKCKVQ